MNVVSFLKNMRTLKRNMPNIEKILENTKKNSPEYYAEIVVNDYVHLVKFVLKRMKIGKFDKIEFTKGEYGNIEVFAVIGEERTKVDFDCYVSHNDQDETEMRCEIGCLLYECNEADVLSILNHYDFNS